MLSQLPDLVQATTCVFRIEVQIRHPLGQFRQFMDRAGNPCGQPSDHDDPQQDRSRNRIEDELIGDPCTGLDAFHGDTHHEMITALCEPSPHLQIFRMELLIRLALECIVVGGVNDRHIAVINLEVVGIQPRRHDLLIPVLIRKDGIEIQIQHHQ